MPVPSLNPLPPPPHAPPSRATGYHPVLLPPTALTSPFAHSTSADGGDQAGGASGFELELPGELARHDAFLEDDDTTSGCRLLDHVTLTSAAGREEADAGGQLLVPRPDSPPAGGGSLADQLFAEAAAGVLDSTDPGAMVLDDRVPMVGVEMELNDQ